MEQLFIRLSANAPSAEPLLGAQWLCWNASQSELIASGEISHNDQLSQLTEQGRNRRVIAYVPSTEVLQTQVELPASAMRMLAQVIPNSLEDELAQDIADLHFCWPSLARKHQGPIPVNVVAHDKMEQWLAAFEAQGLSVDAMYADSFMLPVAATPETIITTCIIEGPLGKEQLVRTGPYSGFSAEPAIAQMLLDHLVGEQQATLIDPTANLEHPLSLMALTYNNQLNDTDADTDASTDASADQKKASVRYQRQIAPINLRQHSYKPVRKKSSGGSFKYKSAAIAAGILVVLGYTSQVIEYVQLGQQSTALQQAIEDTYKGVFPNETRIVNVRSQLNQHLSGIGSKGASESPLTLLQALEPAFNAQQDIKLELVRYDANTLRLQVRAESFASLENFRKVANQGGRISVEQGPTSNQDGAINGNLTIKRAG
ncbi:type II secretion system protein GspL [Pseudidiomarina sp. GXY010]|uniref:Type II secretion system protein L n=1 Tax=Pseudidiomarina fusca TaxID=2965078 RepID=A0ABU3KXT1_9GAMM|nr:type II secretion system protein GspL [Pseudidiomarina sp. GXY010]MDT7526174.1 type II secretion system protein GspL [Pseudidiomarina sp. GXY010]